MTELLSRWEKLAAAPALRVLAVIIISIVVARILKAFTNKLVEMAKSPTRLAQMREQQTRTMAALMAMREAGFDISPVEAAAAVASVALGFGAQNLIKDLINGFFIVFEDQ